MNWTIRWATLEDLDRIVELLLQLYDVVAERGGLRPEAFEETCLRLLSEKTSYFLVAEREGRLIGFLNFTVRGTCLHPGCSALIDELVIDLDHRGAGVGRCLVEEAVRHCRSLGCSEVEVSTEIANARALKFYKGLGFQEIGVLLERNIEENEPEELPSEPVA